MLCIGTANHFKWGLNQQKYSDNFSALQWHRFPVSKSVLIYEDTNIEQLFLGGGGDSL